MNQVIRINPFRCRMWGYHDRIEDHLTEEACKLELKSFQDHGQLVPVLGRPLQGDPDHDVEVVCGARRLFVARTLNVPLQVDLRHISDREAFIAMDIENRHRKDLTPYERGISYKRLLRSGCFQSQDDMANALGVSSPQVSRLLKLAKLPAVISSAFASPLDIREGWGIDLYDSWQNPAKRRTISERARALAKTLPRPPSARVYEILMSSTARNSKRNIRMRDEVITASNGAPLFRIRYQRQAVAVLLPIKALSDASMAEIKSMLSSFLQREIAQAIVSPTVSTHRMYRSKFTESASDLP